MARTKKDKTAKKRTRKSRPLVSGYLERTSSMIFERYRKQLEEIAGQQHGVYALYKGRRLWYVGLASDLRRRIKQHLDDKHARKWDRFSIYLVRKADHIKEIESIVLRIADPEGNAATGRLPKAVNLKKQLAKMVSDQQKIEREKLFGVGSRKTAKKTIKKRESRITARGRGLPALAGLVTKGFQLRAEVKGKRYKASVRKNGLVNYKGIIYNSPSQAAIKAIGRNQNGWQFWEYRNDKGEWVKLGQLKNRISK